MANNTTRNIAAEFVADQVQAAIRDGEPIPDNLNLVAAAARTFRVEDLPEGCRESGKELFDAWAEQEGVDRPTN